MTPPQLKAKTRFNALLKHLEEGVRLQSALLAQGDAESLRGSAQDLEPFWQAIAEARQGLTREEIAPFLARLSTLSQTAATNLAATEDLTTRLRAELSEMARIGLRFKQIGRHSQPPSPHPPLNSWA